MNSRNQSPNEFHDSARYLATRNKNMDHDIELIQIEYNELLEKSKTLFLELNNTHWECAINGDNIPPLLENKRFIMQKTYLCLSNNELTLSDLEKETSQYKYYNATKYGNVYRMTESVKEFMRTGKLEKLTNHHFHPVNEIPHEKLNELLIHYPFYDETTLSASIDLAPIQSEYNSLCQTVELRMFIFHNAYENHARAYLPNEHMHTLQEKIFLLKIASLCLKNKMTLTDLQDCIKSITWFNPEESVTCNLVQCVHEFMQKNKFELLKIAREKSKKDLLNQIKNNLNPKNSTSSKLFSFSEDILKGIITDQKSIQAFRATCRYAYSIFTPYDPHYRVKISLQRLKEKHGNLTHHDRHALYQLIPTHEIYRLYLSGEEQQRYFASAKFHPFPFLNFSSQQFNKLHNAYKHIFNLDGDFTTDFCINLCKLMFWNDGHVKFRPIKPTPMHPLKAATKEAYLKYLNDYRFILQLDKFSLSDTNLFAARKQDAIIGLQPINGHLYTGICKTKDSNELAQSLVKMQAQLAAEKGPSFALKIKNHLDAKNEFEKIIKNYNTSIHAKNISDLDKLKIIATFIAEFIIISPFQVGNTRRTDYYLLLLNHLLIRNDFPPVILYNNLSILIEKTPEQILPHLIQGMKDMHKLLEEKKLYDIDTLAEIPGDKAYLKEALTLQNKIEKLETSKPFRK